MCNHPSVNFSYVRRGIKGRPLKKKKHSCVCIQYSGCFFYANLLALVENVYDRNFFNKKKNFFFRMFEDICWSAVLDAASTKETHMHKIGFFLKILIVCAVILQSSTRYKRHRLRYHQRKYHLTLSVRNHNITEAKFFQIRGPGHTAYFRLNPDNIFTETFEVSFRYGNACLFDKNVRSTPSPPTPLIFIFSIHFFNLYFSF